MSLFAKMLGHKDITREAPEIIWSWVNTSIAAPAVATVLDGQKAPEIFSLPDWAEPKVFWDFEAWEEAYFSDGPTYYLDWSF